MIELLEYTGYKKNEWKICCDLKFVGMLCGMQGDILETAAFIAFGIAAQMLSIVNENSGPNGRQSQYQVRSNRQQMHGA